MKLQTIFATMVTALTLTAVAASTTQVSASDTQTQISSNQNATDKLVAELNAAQAQVVKLNNQITDKNSAIKDAQAKITATTARIAALKVEVAKTQKELASRKQVLKSQLVSLQKQAGDSVTGNVYVDFMLNSDDLSDLISRTSTVNKLNQANKDALSAVNEAKDKLASLQDEQEAKKQTLTDTKSKLEVEKIQLTGLKDDATKQSDALNKKILANKDTLLALQAKAEKEDAAAKAALAKVSAAAAAAKASATTTTKSDSIASATKSSTTKSTNNTASASGSNSATSTGTKVSVNSGGNSYAVGQCTWYVKSVAPWAGNHWGNGAQWGASAASEGFSVNHQPSVGSIVVFAAGQSVGGHWTADGSYGHVAYVVGVSGNSITIQQGGMGFPSPTGPNTDTISGAGNYTYIHR